MVISNGDKRRERFGNPLNRCRRRRDLSTDVIIVSVCIPNNIILLLSSPSYHTPVHTISSSRSRTAVAVILTYIHTYMHSKYIVYAQYIHDTHIIIYMCIVYIIIIYYAPLRRCGDGFTRFTRARS